MRIESSASRHPGSRCLLIILHHASRPPNLSTTAIMTPDAALELSLKQLVNVLDKKISEECTRIRSTSRSASHTSMATLTAEVRFQESKGNPRILTRCFAGRCHRETSQRDFTANSFFEEFDTTCEPSSSRGPRVLRHLRLRCRSATNHPLDPRLSILARIHRL